MNIVEPLLRGHPDESPPLWKGHFSGAKGVASQERFDCNIFFKKKTMKSEDTMNIFIHVGHPEISACFLCVSCFGVKFIELTDSFIS